jgi:hypothetical protein
MAHVAGVPSSRPRCAGARLSADRTGGCRRRPAPAGVSFCRVSASSAGRAISGGGMGSRSGRPMPCREPRVVLSRRTVFRTDRRSGGGGGRDCARRARGLGQAPCRPQRCRPAGPRGAPSGRNEPRQRQPGADPCRIRAPTLDASRCAAGRRTAPLPSRSRRPWPKCRGRAEKAALEDLESARSRLSDTRVTVDAARMTMLARRGEHHELKREGEMRERRLAHDR